MRLLMEVVPATRRSSWLFPILPFIWGFVIASSLVNAGPTYLLAVPKIIRPGANLTIGVRLLKESPSSIRIQAQVLLANKSILQGEAVFERGSVGVAWWVCGLMDVAGEGYCKISIPTHSREGYCKIPIPTPFWGQPEVVFAGSPNY